MDYRNVRINLTACRVNAEKTQKEWAEMIGVSPSTVLNWEAKKSAPDAIQLRKISEFSGIPMDFIFVSDEYD